MSYRKGIFRVTLGTSKALVEDSSGEDRQVFHLSSGIHDKSSLFSAIRKAVPLDPPLSGHLDSWDALEDSLWSGLYAVPERNLIIVWPEASELLRASPKDFETAAAILEDITNTLDDPTVTNGPVKSLAILLEGHWT